MSLVSWILDHLGPVILRVDLAWAPRIEGLRVHLLHERCPFGPGVWCSDVCQWLAEDGDVIQMSPSIEPAFVISCCIY